MMTLTKEQLIKLAPNVGPHAGLYVNALTAAMNEFGIDTPLRRSHFLTQLLHESGDLQHFRENMNYSANGLMKTWPSRFKTKADAMFYERQPAKIANFVYANRMGNGDEKSGDGWVYRGAGWIQLTGKTAIKECGQHFRVVGDIPAWLTTPHGAAMSAAWFWWKNRCNALADLNSVDAVSDVINIGHRTAKLGDSIGYEKRLMLTNLALKVFG